jgi:hypothetical protein
VFYKTNVFTRLYGTTKFAAILVAGANAFLVKEELASELSLAESGAGASVAEDPVELASVVESAYIQIGYL